MSKIKLFEVNKLSEMLPFEREIIRLIRVVLIFWMILNLPKWLGDLYLVFSGNW